MDKKAIGLLILLVLVGVVMWGCGKGQTVSNETTYTGLSVSPDAVTLSVGSTQQFAVTGLVKGSSANTYTVNWVVVGSIGTIDATGLFTATSEGSGTIEARVDSVVGRSTVTVSAGRVITGKVKNILVTGEVVSSAVVIAGNKTTKSGSDGTYQLAGVSPETETISAVAPNFVSTTIAFSGEAVNLPMGYPVQTAYFSSPSESTVIKGRIVDDQGNPLGYSAISQFAIVFENSSSSGTGMISATGTFSTTISVPQDKSSITGYVMVVSKESNSVYNAALKEVTLVRGVTLEVGDIVVNEPAATISGTVFVPSGFSLYGVSCGIVFPSSTRTSFITAYYWGGLTGNSFTIRLPATPAGRKFFISAWATKGNDPVYKYINDLSLSSGGSYTYDISLPAGLSLVYPASGQSGVNNTPRFQWSSLGDGFTYLVLIGQNIGMKWWGFTDKNYIDYPYFPVGSGGEGSNLLNGQAYYLAVIGFKIPSVDMKDVKWEDFSTYTDSSQMSYIAFTVGTPSGSSVRAMDVKGKEKFGEQVREFLGKLGLLHEGAKRE